MLVWLSQIQKPTFLLLTGSHIALIALQKHYNCNRLPACNTSHLFMPFPQNLISFSLHSLHNSSVICNFSSPKPLTFTSSRSPLSTSHFWMDYKNAFGLGCACVVGLGEGKGKVMKKSMVWWLGK